MKRKIYSYAVPIFMILGSVYWFTPGYVNLSYIATINIEPRIDTDLIDEIKWMSLTGSDLRKAIASGYNFSGGGTNYRIHLNNPTTIDDNSFYYISFNCDLWSIRFSKRTYVKGYPEYPESYWSNYSLISKQNDKINLYKGDTFMRVKGDERKIVLYPFMAILIVIFLLTTSIAFFYLFKVNIAYSRFEGRISFKLVEILHNSFFVLAISFLFLFLLMISLLFPS